MHVTRQVYNPGARYSKSADDFRLYIIYAEESLTDSPE
jgi:hypothetical protein